MNFSDVSIIIPTKNEGKGIESVIKSVKKYAKEVVIVDANSNDGTKEIAKKCNTRFYLDHGKGKGDAIKIGLKKSKGKLIIIFDSDGSPNAKDIPNLIKEINKGYDMVITSRRTGGSYDYDITPTGILRTFGSDLMTYLVNKKFNKKYSDILYNFRIIKRSVLKNIEINADGFDIEQEMLVRVLEKGYKVKEIPSLEFARKWGKSKLNTFTGIFLLIKLIKILYF